LSKDLKKKKEKKSWKQQEVSKFGDFFFVYFVWSWKYLDGDDKALAADNNFQTKIISTFYGFEINIYIQTTKNNLSSTKRIEDDLNCHAN